jgi:hypothetical protein
MLLLLVLTLARLPPPGLHPVCIVCKDMTSLLAIAKTIGIFCTRRGLSRFSGITVVIAKVFPTYYLFSPVMTITQKGGGWSDVAGDVAVLVVLAVVLVAGRRRKASTSREGSYADVILRW